MLKKKKNLKKNMQKKSRIYLSNLQKWLKNLENDKFIFKILFIKLIYVCNNISKCQKLFDHFYRNSLVNYKL